MEKPCEILKGKISNATKKNVWSQCRFFAARSGQYNFSIKLRVMDYKKRATTTSETEAPECSFRGRGTSLLISGHNMAPLIGLGQFLVDVHKVMFLSESTFHFHELENLNFGNF